MQKLTKVINVLREFRRIILASLSFGERECNGWNRIVINWVSIPTSDAKCRECIATNYVFRCVDIVEYAAVD